MFEIHVEGGFAAGHALRGYQGKCENQHGHNYKVLVALSGETLDEIGLLIDFKDLRGALDAVMDRLDHQNLNDLEAFKEMNPSAENMARYIYQELKALLKEQCKRPVFLNEVRVWETDRNSVSYYE